MTGSSDLELKFGWFVVLKELFGCEVKKKKLRRGGVLCSQIRNGYDFIKKQQQLPVLLKKKELRAQFFSLNAFQIFGVFCVCSSPRVFVY
ncbi:hypothetical protein A4A49_40729 [Nicotiana attenuata]|uniref:Uncharacterized protein n=1 Tax=Nicotiana attenuata TaxID=49451 RepID=A0A1J6JPM5_NICAT|nr:hypothetical protein A4A49_40729 [Nicotiana attenuata]